MLMQSRHPTWEVGCRGGSRHATPFPDMLCMGPLSPDIARNTAHSGSQDLQPAPGCRHPRSDLHCSQLVYVRDPAWEVRLEGRKLLSCPTSPCSQSAPHTVLTAHSPNTMHATVPRSCHPIGAGEQSYLGDRAGGAAAAVLPHAFPPFPPAIVYTAHSPQSLHKMQWVQSGDPTWEVGLEGRKPPSCPNAP